MDGAGHPSRRVQGEPRRAALAAAAGEDVVLPVEEDLRGAAGGSARPRDHRGIRAGQGRSLRQLLMTRRVVKLPARMKRVATVLALGAFVVPVLSGCSKHHEVPAPEGQTVKIGGLSYVVYITRELNLRDPEDHD